MKNADKPAYPCESVIYQEGKSNKLVSYDGLTKREMFAMAAMQGLCSAFSDTAEIAERAVKVADQLLKELENNQQPK